LKEEGANEVQDGMNPEPEKVVGMNRGNGKKWVNRIPKKRKKK